MPPFKALNIRIKLLVPFIIALVLVFVSAQYILYAFQHEQQQRQLNETGQHLHAQLSHHLQQDSEHFRHSIALMLHPQDTLQAWKQQDSVALRERCQPFFHQLDTTLQLQQLDFYTVNGDRFLGLGKQSTATDQAPPSQQTRSASLHTAMASKRLASGIEIDASGQLLHRLVIPWQQNGELLGYLQLGKSFEHTIHALTQLHHTPIIISSESYSGDPAAVLIQTMEQTPAELLRLIQRGESYKNRIITLNQQRHLVSGFTLQDLQQNNIARLSFLYNIEQQLQSRKQILFSMLVFFTLIGLAVSLFYFIYSGRVAQTLKSNYQKLKLEVNQHKQTEQELIQNKNVLEQLVIERNKSLTESKRRYQTLFDKSADALILLNDDGFVDCNQATLDMFGYKDTSELYKLHPSSISPEFQPDGELSSVKADLMVQKALQDGSHCFEWQHQRKNGETFPAEVILTVIPSREEQLVHAVVRDISERKKAEEEIRFRAYYDSLTRLPNRQLLLDRLEQAIMTSQRSEDYNAILFIDLDRFKSINDSLGHNTGDLLLIDTAARIKHCIREIDTAARFGGDEYVVLLKHIGKEQDEASFNAKRIAQSINRAFQQPFILSHQEIHITCSIGITIFPIADDSVEDIIKHADTAMYSAKESGRNKIAFYLSEMHETVLQRLALEKDLRTAVKNKQLSVHYQPQLDQHNRVIGVEALARWMHPEHGFVNPETFIEIAEETGLINELGQFILEQSISDMLSLQQDNCMPAQLSVNISPHQFRHNEFISIIKSTLGLHQLEPHFLTLEVTESVIINNLNETIGKFDELRQLDIRMSLDDFGTGYSSLSHLKRLPLDELKIDKSFVFDLLKDPHDALLVQTILNIANEFGLDTVAEGVEDEDQLAFLQSKGCKYYQGYYFSRPLPLAQLKAFMQKKLIYTKTNPRIIHPMRTPGTQNSDQARTIYSVSELNRTIRDLLESQFPLLWIEGEISNLARPASGHIYFTLKDERAQVRCAMFKSRNLLVRFTPENGQKVLIRARVGLYEARGEFQLVAEHMEEAGDGALQRAFDELKARLAAEGLFDSDKKREIPQLPQHIGIISSATGAAVRDVLSVLKRRFPSIPVSLYPVAVQGDKAVPEIIRALALAQMQQRCDVLLLVRGGGSLEDLWAFNEEAVARAIVDCTIPIVCGVGHEVDITIADFAADQRAPTPSAAAELVSPDQQTYLHRFNSYRRNLIRLIQQQLKQADSQSQWLQSRLRLQHPRTQLTQQVQQLDDLSESLQDAFFSLLSDKKHQLKYATQGLLNNRPDQFIDYQKIQLDDLSSRLHYVSEQQLETRQQQLANLCRTLQAVSPLNTLSRGYSITQTAAGKTITDAAQVKSGEQIISRLHHGKIKSRVE